jgi:hypothetical protein
LVGGKAKLLEIWWFTPTVTSRSTFRLRVARPLMDTVGPSSKILEGGRCSASWVYATDGLVPRDVQPGKTNTEKLDVARVDLALVRVQSP